MGPPAARLEVIAGNAVGMSVLVDSELVIGRNTEGAGRLADDKEISRSHARVTLDGEGVCVIDDLGSTNGTYVNGHRISGPQTLLEGDAIELGGTTLVVRELPQPETAEPSPALDAQPTLVGGASQAPSGEATPPTPAPLALRMVVDFAAREARLVLDDESEPVRLAFDGEAWRVAPSSG
jgi:predicted component of type VI protein secretion system